MGRLKDIQTNLGEAGLQRWEIRTGQYLVQVFSESFDKLGFGGGKWKPRARLSVPAIVPELARGQRISQHWFDTTPGSARPNELLQSLAWRRVRAGVVEAGSNLKYASDQQHGTTKTVRVTGPTKKAIAGTLKDDRRLNKADKKKLGWLASRDSVAVRIPARPFVGYTPEMERRVRKFAVEEVLRG